jgi:hypothetical protein
MGTRYHLVEILTQEKDKQVTHYRIYDQRHKRYFRRDFKTQKDALFFMNILNQADRSNEDPYTDGTPKNSKTEDDND